MRKEALFKAGSITHGSTEKSCAINVYEVKRRGHGAAMSPSWREKALWKCAEVINEAAAALARNGGNQTMMNRWLAERYSRLADRK